VCDHSWPPKTARDQTPRHYGEVREYLDTVMRRDVERRRRALAASLQQQSTCAICLVDFERGEPLARLECGHRFHAACVDQLAEHHALSRAPERCPCCQRACFLSMATTAHAGMD